MKNTSIAEYARIRVELISGFLTTMLVADLIGLTLTLSAVNSYSPSPVQMAMSLFVFCSITGVVLFFLAKRYLDSIQYRFGSIEEDQMRAIAEVAKRFFLPFMLSLAANILLVVLGALTWILG